MNKSGGKTILITGAGNGIGYETAIMLANEPGNTVIALSRNEKALQDLRQQGSENIIPLVFDLETGNFQSLAAEKVIQALPHLDILIHNAGKIVNKPFESITADELKGCYTVNVFAPYLLTQALLPLLKKSSKAHIVHISSVGGIQGSVKFAGLSAYSSSKGALSILTECLAEEFSQTNIKVNCLALGAVQTDMLNRAFPGYKAPLTAKEMGSYVARFAMDGNNYFNGKIIPVALSTP